MRDLPPPPIYGFRALVAPCVGEYSGKWYACVRYQRVPGGYGTLSLGGYGLSWEQAARIAVRQAESMARDHEASLRARAKPRRF